MKTIMEMSEKCPRITVATMLLLTQNILYVLNNSWISSNNNSILKTAMPCMRFSRDTHAGLLAVSSSLLSGL